MDFNLRELEIDTALSYMQDGDKVLDVGCGLGYALGKYAAQRQIKGYGIDYAENMVKVACQVQAESPGGPPGTIEFKHASVLDLPYEKEFFDVVTSSRCLMALLDWKRQKEALLEISRVLRQGGVLVLMEGTVDGLTRLNEVRTEFGLSPIDASGRDRLCTLKFIEKELLEFCNPFYKLEKIQRFGMYYFLSRVVHPLLAAPEPPRYDARINEVAREIARKIPDFKGLGHLVAFIFRKL